MICERCALLPECPSEVRGAYGRACWLAFGEGRPLPDCKGFVARNERYWRGSEERHEWRRARRSIRHGRQRV